jgi:hypothetical protein
MRTREAPAKTIDITRICGIISKIGNDLNTMRGIKANLTKIGKTADTITTDIKTLEKNIRSSLEELQDALKQNTSATK